MNTSAARDALPAGLVLAAAAALLWSGHATLAGVSAAVAAALAGATGGELLAGSRLRLSAAILAALSPAAAGLLLGWALDLLLARVPLPGPEMTLALLDIPSTAGPTLAAAALLVLLARRLPLLAPLPTALVVLVAALPLLPHRGGMIHRPRIVAELAWSRGLHPVLVLATVGAAAGLLGLLALARGREARRRGRDLVLLALLAGLLAFLLPSAGLLRVPPVDPLGLGRKDGARGEQGREDRARPRRELLPFRDDVNTSRQNVPVAVVLFHDDVTPFDGVYRFRQAAFSSWNGRRLVRGLLPGLDRDLFPGLPGAGALRRPVPPGEGLRQRLATTVALLADHPYPPVLVDGIELAPEQNPDPSLFRGAFRAVSSVLVHLEPSLVLAAAGDPGWPADVRAAYLQVPQDPRYRQLATGILEAMPEGERRSPLLRAVAVARWLERNTLYSTHTRHASAPDPTASFLFGDRVGYCVHLAHATALLCRALGVPSRVAAGYACPATYRGGGSALVIRAGDAHAWCEIRLAGVGWLPIDPRPPSLDPEIPGPDPDLQRLLGELARSRDQRLVREVPAPLRLPSPRTLARWGALLLLAWLLAGLSVKGWRRLAPLAVVADPAGRRIYRATLDRLGEVGLGRRPGETREAHAARLAEQVPSFGALTRMHLAAVLGTHPVDRPEALRLARRVRRELARAVPRWRRLLGLLAPWSWRRTR